MLDTSKTRIFDFVYNAAKKTARLTFKAFSGSRPDEQPSFTIVGPYCELRRSPREHVILKLKNRQMLEALRKAREVHVAEQGQNGTVWHYKIKRR